VLDRPPEPVDVRVDPRRIAEVLSNLLSNAVKFTPAGGRVSVRVEREGGDAVLRVVDTGIGLTEEQRGRLFQPFVEVHTHSPTVQSTGLGLYIAKALVERHGGTLACESQGTGHGSLFVARLPLFVPT
jgi:signal transduction histidine kinase